MMLMLGSVATVAYFSGWMNVDRIPAVHAFSNPEKEGSNAGKLIVAHTA